MRKQKPACFRRAGFGIGCGVGFEPTTFGLWPDELPDCSTRGAKCTRADVESQSIGELRRMELAAHLQQARDPACRLAADASRSASTSGAFRRRRCGIGSWKVDEAMMMAGPRQESNLYLALRRHTSHLPLSLILQGIPVVFQGLYARMGHEWDKCHSGDSTGPQRKGQQPHGNRTRSYPRARHEIYPQRRNHQGRFWHGSKPYKERRLKVLSSQGSQERRQSITNMCLTKRSKGMDYKN